MVNLVPESLGSASIEEKVMLIGSQSGKAIHFGG